MVRFNSDLDGLKPTDETVGFHNEFAGVFGTQTIFSAKEALFQRDLNRLTELKSSFILMDASIDGRNIEAPFEDEEKEKYIILGV